MEKVTYIAELDQDIDDMIAVEYLHRLGALKEVVLDPYPKTKEGIDRVHALKDMAITVLGHMPAKTDYVFVGGALTLLASYLINHKIKYLVMNGGFVGQNILDVVGYHSILTQNGETAFGPVDVPLEKFRDKQYIRTFNFNCDAEAADKVLKSKNVGLIMLIGKNVCHHEKNTRKGIWKSETFMNKYKVKPEKRMHDLLACREGLIQIGFLQESPYLMYDFVRPCNTGLAGNQTKWGSTFGDSPYQKVYAAIGWLERSS